MPTIALLDQRIDHLLRPGVVDMHFDLLLDLYDKRARPNVLVEDFLPTWQAGSIGVLGVNAVLLSHDVRNATLDHYVDHVAYVASLAGIDSVAIGFDFIEFLYLRWSPEEQAALNTALTPPCFVPDLGNHSHTRHLTRRLIERGFSDEEIGKVLYGNWMRLFAQLL